MKQNYIPVAREVLSIEAETLQKASEALDESINLAVNLILETRGKLIVTGVGKSGLIGAKIAATMASTGTPSFFLHPTEALHGDLGMIGKEDAVLAISYSGESEELSSILPHIKRFDIPLIGLTRSAESTLGRYSDVLVPIRVEREACPLGVAPTSSTTLTLAVGDALAVCLMKARDFQKEDFASFHPGGSLGRKLFVKVADVMRKEQLPVTDENTPLKEAIVTMSEGRLGAVLLTGSDGTLRGLLTDGDLRRALMRPGFDINAPAKTYATPEPRTVRESEMLASDALVLMEEKKIQLLIVTDAAGHIHGVLHLHDLVEKGIA
ncbi:KpsF/GutQ family sugar-phosphate isomerase [Sulfurimonas sp. HSL1-6]|uniref:KpsF/GutQ family sugar-phosphate isomerase n=1 Tax=Thiomicrolovo immobilis TaxID=3131935 RepID=UPI0031F8989F